MTRRGEQGYTLIMMMAAMTIMLITMGLGVPFWRYVVKDDREQELLFRGEEIASAIERYQARNASAPPPTLEVLVEQRFLRRLYSDPMSESGKWRLIRPGDAIGPGPGQPAGPGGALTGRATPTPTPAPASTRLSGASSGPGGSSGPGPGGGLGQGQVFGGGIVGVSSTSEEKSFRLLNGRDRYDEWLFIAGQPRVVGRQATAPIPGLPGGSGPGTTGAIGPTPLPKPSPSRLDPNRR